MKNWNFGYGPGTYRND